MVTEVILYGESSKKILEGLEIYTKSFHFVSEISSQIHREKAYAIL